MTEHCANVDRQVNSKLLLVCYLKENFEQYLFYVQLLNNDKNILSVRNRMTTIQFLCNLIYTLTNKLVTYHKCRE